MTHARSQARTLYDKLIDSHTVRDLDDGRILLYVDFHVMNEYTSPQAFTGLHEAARPVWRPGAHLAVIDHVNPTRPISSLDDMTDDLGRIQIENLGRNCEKHGIEIFSLFDRRQGIEHVVVPENGYVQPGMVVVCGDSHTTTYGAFGALGFGIGTSEIEHVLATQTLVYRKMKSMRVTFAGPLSPGITGKDLVMAFIAEVGVAGAVGHVVEFTGQAIDDLSVEGRMTLCNMAVEAGARGAIIAPDEKIYDYLKGKPQSPDGPMWDRAQEYWRGMRSDADADFDAEVSITATDIAPQVSWGTSPDQSCAVTGSIPEPETSSNDADRAAAGRALQYMGLTPGTAMNEIAVNKAFIGSCTNGRIEDLRAAAAVVKGRAVAPAVQAMVVPGSLSVRRQAEAEGLDRIFIDAGFEWRGSGCSMCLAMNDDVLLPGDRCASSTNRNFEGRQGLRARTHLMSPAMVAAAAVTGRICDFRDLIED